MVPVLKIAKKQKSQKMLILAIAANADDRNFANIG